MLSFAPTPIFSSSWDHRPAVSSPLSSSPVRASSPLSPIDRNALPQRQIQSSPIQPPKFKFASRPTRPNPVLRKREDIQEGRRRLFLQNVRQKSEDKAWQRRDIEGQFLKTNYLADKGQLSHDAPDVTDADIEDAMAFQQEQSQIPEEDEMMMDEDEQFEAMLASYEDQQTTSSQPPSSTLSDEDYDDIFAELIAQEQSQQAMQSGLHYQMDASGDTEMQ
ncbi:hypothetical protein NM208_g15095 [Fusarium decemcellulare]|uniref:Uncharacterized protein n=1 Tax=Fusarium decemcellulare TaxID=57161 RepID=A0ACC1RE16_9HYPO|nr:hypothetical protein NM208_g15095 [Fusarium decemcellulare]